MKNCPACNNTYPADFTLCPRDGTKLVAVNAWAEGAVIRGKYRILAKLGEGGMGAVYKAKHLVFDELRALKVLSSNLAGDGTLVTRTPCGSKTSTSQKTAALSSSWNSLKG